MSKDFPSRGPRVMHGAGRFLQQARELPETVKNPVDEDKLRKGLLVFKKLLLAERKVERMLLALEQFERQLQTVPEQHPVRITAMQMITSLREQVQLAEKELEE